jgi:hypothetical protein
LALRQRWANWFEQEDAEILRTPELRTPELRE